MESCGRKNTNLLKNWFEPQYKNNSLSPFDHICSISEFHAIAGRQAKKCA
jgi:hypothetical protein